MNSVHPEAEYFAHLAAGRFMLQRSLGTGGHVFPPRVAEPGSGATDLHWVAASGGGVVHSFTIVRAKPPAGDYNVALIDLDEGPRLLSRVDAIGLDELRIGLRVHACIVREGEQPVLVFVPEGAPR